MNLSQTGFFTPVEGRKLARKESESRKWVRHLRTRHSFFCYGCQGIIQLHLVSLFLLSPSSPACFPWPGKSAIGGKSYYGWHVCRGWALIWTWPSWSVTTLAHLQQCVSEWKCVSCNSTAFKVCKPTDCSENEAQWINPVWKWLILSTVPWRNNELDYSWNEH